jgi:hypothetical protein
MALTMKVTARWKMTGTMGTVQQTTTSTKMVTATVQRTTTATAIARRTTDDDDDDGDNGDDSNGALADDDDVDDDNKDVNNGDKNNLPPHVGKRNDGCDETKTEEEETVTDSVAIHTTIKQITGRGGGRWQRLRR